MGLLLESGNVRARLHLDRSRRLTVLRTFAQSAALATMLLGGTAARAAGPATFQLALVPAAPAVLANGPNRNDPVTGEGDTSGHSKIETTALYTGSSFGSIVWKNTLSGTAIDSSGKARKPFDVRVAVEVGTEWSPRTPNWSGYHAAEFDFGPKRSVKALRHPMTALGKGLRISRFTVKRNRIQIVLVTAF